MKKITANTTLAEIIKYKVAIKILEKYSVPCLGCPMAKFEMENLKIGDVCKMYGVDIKNLLKELNKVKK